MCIHPFGRQGREESAGEAPGALFFAVVVEQEQGQPQEQGAMIPDHLSYTPRSQSML